jgi:glutathione S-transferase
MSLKLFMHPVSTASRPVCLFIAEKHLPVTEQVVDLMSGEHHQPAYQAINPNQAVPVLEDGDFRMAESSAILKYLAARFDAPEYPKDLRERARVDSMMDWFNTGFHQDFGHGLVYPQILPNHKRRTDEQNAGTIAWGRDKARTWLCVLDNHTLGSNDYVANNHISIADYFGVCLLTAGELVGCTFEGYPNIQRWIGSMKKLASWGKVNEVLYGFAQSMAGKSFEKL